MLCAVRRSIIPRGGVMLRSAVGSSVEGTQLALPSASVWGRPQRCAAPVGARAMSVQRRNRHKKMLKLSKGYRGRAKNCYRIAINRVEKGLLHAYRHRKLKQRVNRRLWIVKVNAGAREHGLSYSQLINAMKLTSVQLNRKVMSELAAEEPFTFRAVVEAVVALHPDPDSLARVSKDPNGDMRASGIRGSAITNAEEVDITELLEEGDVEIGEQVVGASSS